MNFIELAQTTLAAGLAPVQGTANGAPASSARHLLPMFQMVLEAV